MALRSTARSSLSILALALPAAAQTQLDWLAAHDGPQSQSDFGRVCAVDGAGNVYVAGRSYNPSVGFPPFPPQADFEVVKYSSAGATQWTARTDVFGSEDFALDIAVAPNGDVYVTGYAWNGNGIDLALIRYDAGGVWQWTQTFAGPGGGSDFGRALGFDVAGRVLVGATISNTTTQSDLGVICFDTSGQIAWQTTRDGGVNGADAAYAMTVLSNGEIALAGQAATASGLDAAVLKLHSDGSFAWLSALDGGSNLTDAAFAVASSGSSRVVAAGYRTSSSTGEDVFAFELDAAGAVAWSGAYDGPAHASDRGRAAGIGIDGVAWIAGISAGSGTGTDFVTLRFSASGAQLSALRWNGAANLDDSAIDLVNGSAGQTWVIGSSTVSSAPLDVDVAIAQYDVAGALDWSRTFSTPGAFDDKVYDGDAAPNDRIALAGATNGGGSGDYDYLALQVSLADSPQAYCTPKTTSNGCVPSVTFTGSPSASATGGFTVRATQLRNNKSALLFYGLSGAAASPFQGGTLCVHSPIVRTMLQNSGGNPAPADDCSGSVALDMNAFASGALGGTPAPALHVAGTTVHCQSWGRDPGFAPPQNTMLSSGLRYVVLP